MRPLRSREVGADGACEVRAQVGPLARHRGPAEAHVADEVQMQQVAHRGLGRWPCHAALQPPDDSVQPEQGLVGCQQVKVEDTTVAVQAQGQQRQRPHAKRAGTALGRRRQPALEQALGRRYHVFVVRGRATQRVRCRDAGRPQMHDLPGQHGAPGLGRARARPRRGLPLADLPLLDGLTGLEGSCTGGRGRCDRQHGCPARALPADRSPPIAGAAPCHGARQHS